VLVSGIQYGTGNNHVVEHATTCTHYINVISHSEAQFNTGLNQRYSLLNVSLLNISCDKILILCTDPDMDATGVHMHIGFVNIFGIDQGISKTSLKLIINLKVNCRVTLPSPLRTEVYFCHQNQNAKNIGNFTP
jgi:hypothetical protein